MTAALIPTITLSTPIAFFEDLKGHKYQAEERQTVLEIIEGRDGKFAPFATRSERDAHLKKVAAEKAAEEARIQAEKKAAEEKAAREEAARIAAEQAAAEAERIRLANEAAAAEAARLEALKQPVKTRGVIPGNGYVEGNCTWYAKSRRPDLPNNLGNANTWATEAAAQGIPTGSRPRPGAIGVSLEGYYGHVVYVESVNGDGTMTISEMNYGGLYQMNTRTISPAGWSFVY